MKIAVATSDGVSVSQHFGRSAGFVVFEVEGRNIKSREVRTNNQTPHAQGLCDGHHGHAAHSHTGIVGLLADCDIVLCGGMGAGAAQALVEQGIQPMVLPGACSAEDAVSQYLNGGAKTAQNGFCNCHH